MLVKILHMRQDLFIITIKKRNKGIYGKSFKKDLAELKEEAIDTQMIP